MISVFVISFIYPTYASSPGGINEDLGSFTFHTESDDNPDLSFVPNNIGPTNGTIDNFTNTTTTINNVSELDNTR